MARKIEHLGFILHKSHEVETYNDPEAIWRKLVEVTLWKTKIFVIKG